MSGAGTGSAARTDAREAAAGALVRPLWRRVRFWVVLGALLAAGAAVVSLLSPGSGRPLDPDSALHGGSKALAQVLRRYGVAVGRTTSVAAAAASGRDTAVVVTQPDAYAEQRLVPLLAGAGRVVLLDPDRTALAALAPGVSADDEDGGGVGGTSAPGCGDPGAVATGPVDLGEAGVTTYSAGSGAITCYDGTVVLAGRVAVLGSADLLRNDALGRRGVAGLDVNVLSAERGLTRVTFLLPGADAAGSGPPSVWDLFPRGAHRAFLWLLLTGVVLVLGQARRLGPPVPEPLPVVVRSAEAVEGHGRLYRRVGARARAAAALRAGTTGRLARHLGLPRGAGATDVVAALAPPDAARVGDVLAGPAPQDDRELVALATALRELESAAGLPPEGEDER